MPANPFVDRTVRPDEAALADVLGKARTHWDALLAFLEAEYAGLRREWKFYGAKYGWQLKVASRKSAVLYLVPYRGSFLGALALKGQAIEAVRTSRLPPELVRGILSAKEYAEGKPARIEVTGKKQVEIMKQLVAFKLGRAPAR